MASRQTGGGGAYIYRRSPTVVEASGVPAQYAAPGVGAMAVGGAGEGKENILYQLWK